MAFSLLTFALATHGFIAAVGVTLAVWATSTASIAMLLRFGTWGWMTTIYTGLILAGAVAFEPSFQSPAAETALVLIAASALLLWYCIGRSDTYVLRRYENIAGRKP